MADQLPLTPPAASMTRGWAGFRWRLSMLVVVVYAAAMVLPLMHAHGDPSIFVLAGDHFVDASALPAPIIVQPHSPGFDGQFYYRMALDPFAMQPTAYGITLDAPSLRMMRVFYPFLAWLGAFGHPGWTAAVMVGVNLVGLGLLAGVVERIAQRLALPAWAPLAVMLWPGFLITLMRDTTEIWSALLVLASALAFMSRRVWLFFAAGAAACLTRETGLLAVFGLFCLAVVLTLRREAHSRGLLVASVAAVIPAIGWQLVLRQAFGETASAAESGANLGLPLRGMTVALSDALHGRPPYHGMGHILGPTMHLIVAGTIAALMLWTALVVSGIGRTFRAPALWPLLAAWLPLGLMTVVMTGPWVEPLSYFRAFSESFALGTLLLASRRLPRWVLFGGSAAQLGCWLLCALVLH